MELNYILKKEDYQNLMLYWGSNDKIFINSRRLLYFILIIINLYFYYDYFLNKENFSLPIIFSIINLLYYFYFGKIIFKDSLIKRVNNDYKDFYGKSNSIHFLDDKIVKKDYYFNFEIKYENVICLEELPNYFYINLKTNSRIIIPKTSIQSVEDYKNLIEIFQTRNLPIINKKNWVWK